MAATPSACVTMIGAVCIVAIVVAIVMAALLALVLLFIACLPIFGVILIGWAIQHYFYQRSIRRKTAARLAARRHCH